MGPQGRGGATPHSTQKILFHINSIMPHAQLKLEILVYLRVESDIAPVSKIAHQRDDRFSELPQAYPDPAKNLRHGIEVTVTGKHFFDNHV